MDEEWQQSTERLALLEESFDILENFLIFVFLARVSGDLCHFGVCTINMNKRRASLAFTKNRKKGNQLFRLRPKLIYQSSQIIATQKHCITATDWELS